MVIFGNSSEAQFTFQIAGTSFRVLEFTAVEKLSFPYEVQLSLATEDEINLEDVMGREALLTIAGTESDRFFHGVIDRFVQVGSKGRFFLYQARLVPSLRLLALEQDCRIFQNKTVKDIVSTVLKDAGITSDRFEFRLQGRYHPKEYCVQYRETDLDFISRLLEEEGIFYFFEHSDEKHLLVFGDSTVNYQPIPGEATILYHPSDSRVPGEEFIHSFRFEREIRTSKVTLKDYNFEKPSLDLTTRAQESLEKDLEVYDYPGKFDKEEDGRRLARLSLEKNLSVRDMGFGQSYCPRLTPGLTFQLSEHDLESLNQEYLLTEVNHKGIQPQELEERAETEEEFHYSNAFVCIPSSVQYRPPGKVRRPCVHGLQTAVVTGPSNEEIYTDEHGRVKVQFHWDREGRQDENTTCWLRVGQIWAGKGWGAVFIPRVGDEVLVDFLEGDPDKPIVVGSVYNKENQPLYPLPDEKTKSTIKTKSYPNDTGFNEIRFEDKKGEEEIFIHAQKDMNISVGNNQSTSVSSNRSVSAGNDESKDVGNNQTISVGTKQAIEIGSNQKITVGGDRTKQVKGNETNTINGTLNVTVIGNGNTSILGDRYLLSSNFSSSIMGNRDIFVAGTDSLIVGARLTIAAGATIVIQGGGSSIVIGPGGIIFNSTGPIIMRGPTIQMNC